MLKHNSAILLINLMPSNVLFILTSLDGQILASVSAGQFKPKGSKKVTLTTIKSCFSKISCSLQYEPPIHVKFKGLSKYKRLILKLLTKSFNYNILSFTDTTTFPHNGTKLSKIRRV